MKILEIILARQQFLILVALIVLAYLAPDQREVIVGGVLGYLTNQVHGGIRKDDNEKVD